MKFYDCVVLGALGSDDTSEQYPEGPVCEGCISKQEALREDSQIVSGPGALNDDDDAECLLCGETRDDE